jgi:hypothetical protein
MLICLKDQLFPPQELPIDATKYPRGFSKIIRRILTQEEHANLLSFINTQTEDVLERAGRPELVSSHFLKLLNDKEKDSPILRSMRANGHDLNQYVKKYYKKVEIKKGITITSAADTESRRDSSHVAVRQQVDVAANQPDARMAVKTYFYRINFFFEFSFGSSSFILANANELQPVIHQELEKMDIKGKIF